MNFDSAKDNKLWIHLKRIFIQLGIKRQKNLNLVFQICLISFSEFVWVFCLGVFFGIGSPPLFAVTWYIYYMWMLPSHSQTHSGWESERERKVLIKCLCIYLLLLYGIRTCFLFLLLLLYTHHWMIRDQNGMNDRDTQKCTRDEASISDGKSSKHIKYPII